MSAKLVAISAFRMTTAKPEQLSRFYRALGFTVGDRKAIPSDEIALLGLRCGGTRFPLRLGEQRVDLDSFDEPGRPYPADATSADLCFQHLALVTDDVAAAWVRAARIGAVPISMRPVTLPASAGGVIAMKFRDPEGHPLELLQFPAGSKPGWRGMGVIGIDHSAISVSNGSRSRRFYEAHGLFEQDPTFNHGPTQAVLDGLSGVEVDVIPMMPPEQPPHLELLAYRKPAGASSGRLEANDVAATRIVWRTDRDELVRDPDGHLQLLRRDACRAP